jgi:putative SOS response-associated peptidase YedK
MCGRFTHHYTWREVHDFLDLEIPPAPGGAEDEQSLRPSYNVAPTYSVPVCRLTRDGQRELVPMTWGFNPGWSESVKPGPINARCETVATNPMFRDAYRSRRCLVPANGFYEWQTTGGPKQPYYIRLLNDPLFCFAGLWGSRYVDGRKERTFTILTTNANALVAKVHDRMPVILRPSDHAAWLAGEAPPSVLAPFPADEMEAYPVATRVNTPRHDDRSLLDRVAPAPGLFDRQAPGSDDRPAR